MAELKIQQRGEYSVVSQEMSLLKRLPLQYQPVLQQVQEVCNLLVLLCQETVVVVVNHAASLVERSPL